MRSDLYVRDGVILNFEEVIDQLLAEQPDHESRVNILAELLVEFSTHSNEVTKHHILRKYGWK